MIDKCYYEVWQFFASLINEKCDLTFNFHLFNYGEIILNIPETITQNDYKGYKI